MRFITFEGPEGSGKSTQINILTEKLRQENKKVINIREPGGTILGEKIRDILKSNSFKNLSNRAELLMFIASRAQLIEEIVKPSLNQGHWVICDRFIDSTIAYQGFGRGLCLDDINFLNKIAINNILPSLTFLLQIDVNIGFQRLKSRYQNNSKMYDRIEQEDIIFHKKVYEGYNTLSDSLDRVIKIDAEKDIKEISDIIYKEIKKLEIKLND